MKVVKKTQSLCPQCLRTLDAYYVQKGNEVFFKKSCPSHGHFSIPAWIQMPNTPSFEDWCQSVAPLATINHEASPSACPHACGLCREHLRPSCCVLLEVTQNCNMSCPICYAGAQHGNEASDLSLTEISTRLEMLLQKSGAVNIQLSGGEPTTRDDLPEIIKLVHAKGFDFVQVNTNGLRLGCSKNGKDYAQKLKAAGLNLVYLQWDGMDDAIYKTLRGAKYTHIKEQALQHCQDADLAVLLVVTLVRGVNEHQLGEILQKALSYGSVIRGVHIQPVSSFGRYPWEQTQAPRLTLPEVMYALEQQSTGILKAEHFHPPQSEHALCSFSALYERDEKRGLLPVKAVACCGSKTQGDSISPAIIAREFVAKHWSGENLFTASNRKNCSVQDDFDHFLQKNSFKQRFTVSCMAFQDAYSVDLQRLKACHIHIAESDGRIMPFCAYNLTSGEGFALYRKEKKA